MTLPEGVSLTPGRDLNEAPTVRLDLEGDLPNGSRQKVSLVAPSSEMRALGIRLIEEADQAERQGSLFGVRA